MGLIISLKAFYVLYLIFFIPFIWILFKEKKVDLFLYVFKSSLFYLFLISILFLILIYLLNTGCLIYPVSFTCINNFDWSIGVEETIQMNKHYQLWSKAGKTPNFIIDDPEIYLQNFNWVSNWIDLYFFNKVSDYLVGLFTLCLIVFFIFRNRSFNVEKKYIDIKYVTIIYLFLLILFFEWFLNHPALRYGGYILIASLIFIPFSFYLEKQNNLIDKIKPKLKFIIFFTIFAFLVRNGIRINDEIIKYDYKPFTKSFYFIDNNHFRISNSFNSLINNYENCKNKKEPCDFTLSKKVKEFYPYRYIFKR